MKNVFIIFQYANGLGHLSRCSALAAALSALYKVTLISGGRAIQGYRPPKNVSFIQLPAISWGEDSITIPTDKNLSIAEVKVRRCFVLIEHYQRVKPEIIITEYFPLAPGRFGELFKNFFQTITASKKPLMICSIRAFPNFPFFDSLASPESVNQELKSYYDFVLHHADPALVPINSLSPNIKLCLANIPIYQTGFVRQLFNLSKSIEPSNKLLLTIGGGGGSQGPDLIKLGVKAVSRLRSEGCPLSMDIVCGPLMKESDRQCIRAMGNENIVIHEQLASLDGLMADASAIICMGGYNTLIEALSLNKPILAFPGSHGTDQEVQIMAFKDQGLLLSGSLDQSVDEVASLIRQTLTFKPAKSIQTNGAERSVKIIQKYILNA